MPPIRPALVLLCALAAIPQAQAYTAVFAFGDSLSDTGNLLAATGGGLPDPSYYDRGRFQEGPAWIETLAERLGHGADSVAVANGGRNYAVGDARSRYHAFDLDPMTGAPPALGSTPTALSLLGQVEDYMSDSAGIADPLALYTVWAGSNDVRDQLTLAAGGAPQPVIEAYIAQAAGDIGQAIATLIVAGARNLLVPTLPQLGLTPMVQSLAPAIPGLEDAANALPLVLNAAVDQALSSFTGVAGLTVFRFDAGALLQGWAEDPAAVGLVSGPCLSGVFLAPIPGETPAVCADPQTHLFWDALHPGATAHAWLGEAAAAAVPGPGVLWLMVVPMVLLLQRRTMDRP